MNRLLYILLCCTVVLCGCPKDASRPADTGKLKVAASIYPIADIIRNIGDGRVEVVTIMPPGASPHTFDVSPQTLANMANIKAIFKIGYGLDDWSDRVAISTSADVNIMTVSAGIELRKLPDGSIDPHYWLSIENGIKIAQTVARELTALAPADKDTFAANLEKYTALLRQTDTQIKEKLSAVKSTSFATFHEAWFYFAQAYGLTVAAAFEPFPGKEPTPEYLAEFINTVKQNKIKVIFTEPQFSGDAIKQVADDLKINIESLDPEGGACEQTSTYIGMMMYNADKISNAIGK